MSTEPFIGEIKIFGFNYAPMGHMTCQGQILPIAAYNALYALLGNTYGGNGVSTFGLPDLQGRAVIGQGQGGGLPYHSMGEMAGNENVTIAANQMPMHTHSAIGISVRIPVNTGNEDSGAAGNYIGNSPSGDGFGPVPSMSSLGAPVVGGTTAPMGGSQPLNILNPYLCMNYSIALQGIFPSRS